MHFLHADLQKSLNFFALVASMTEYGAIRESITWDKSGLACMEMVDVF